MSLFSPGLESLPPSCTPWSLWMQGSRLRSSRVQPEKIATAGATLRIKNCFPVFECVWVHSFSESVPPKFVRTFADGMHALCASTRASLPFWQLTTHPDMLVRSMCRLDMNLYGRSFFSFITKIAMLPFAGFVLLTLHCDVQSDKSMLKALLAMSRTRFAWQRGMPRTRLQDV